MTSATSPTDQTNTHTQALTRRRLAIAAHSSQVGIDYINIDYNELANTQLTVNFIAADGIGKNTVPVFSAKNIIIWENRDLGIRANAQINALSFDQETDTAFIELVFVASEQRAFSYKLELLEVENLDPFFSRISFSLDENSPFDPKKVDDTPVAPPVAPPLDYLVKDYQSFRQLMLDRIANLAPDWEMQKDTPDIGMALTELLAYNADLLSYYQDAVANEAYLGTARHRVSVKRHARLLGYQMHEGVSARVWVHIAVSDSVSPVSLPAGVLLATNLINKKTLITLSEYTQKMISKGSLPFESLTAAELYPEHNEISFYSWDSTAPILYKGASSATLTGHFAHLQVGDTLVFEESKSPISGLTEEAEPNNRHIVRLTEIILSTDDLTINNHEITKIQWLEQDCLPFNFVIDSSVAGITVTDISIARGNMILAEHGRWIEGEGLPSIDDDDYTATLERPELSYRVPLATDHTTQSAASVLIQDPREALPVIQLYESSQPNSFWNPVTNFFSSSYFTQGFIVEIDNEQKITLRFSESTQGKRPAIGQEFIANYRIGKGVVGNIGQDSLIHISSDTRDNLTWDSDSITQVRNPLPAINGIDPESAERVKLQAPASIAGQQRCVTLDDYIDVAMQHPQIQRAGASLRWLGSWYGVYVAIDPFDAVTPSVALMEEIKTFMQPYRMMGADLHIETPQYVPVDIKLQIKLIAGYAQATILQNLQEVFSSVDLPSGTQGFFHTDNFSFSQNLYLSSIIATATAIAGVAQVIASEFKAWHNNSSDLDSGVITLSDLEIIQNNNDPETPENGRILFEFQSAGV